MLKVNTYTNNNYLVRTEERFYDILYINNGIWEEKVNGWIVSEYDIHNIINIINQRKEEEIYFTILSKFILFVFGLSIFYFLLLHL